MDNYPNYLLTGGKDQQLLPALRRALRHATEIEIAVSFIKYSGLELIFKDLEDSMQSLRQVKLTLITSDYLCVTDPRALRKLLFLAERGADIRVFEAGKTDSFHLKAYIFVKSEQGVMQCADAFVGSSNISRPALTDGLEWNYHIDYPNEADSLAAQRLNEIRQRFVNLLSLPQVSPLNFEWIEAYQIRYDTIKNVIAFTSGVPGAGEPEPDIPDPKPHQKQALDALQFSRQRGLRKGLVVLATGLGKTYLAAFDVVNIEANRVLFVAHREEILLQAEESFLSVLPNKRVGRYSGKRKDTNCDLLFASVQTLGQSTHLQRFPRDHFDYVVIDEFHHAAAASYQRLIEYFKPKFMLGLTATPDRTDGSDILRLCDNNLIYRKDLFEGITDKQLCNFHYYGIFDEEINYENIPWRNGSFDPERLSTKLATLSRAQHVIKEWRDKSQKRTLAFCASRRHADYMKEFFNKHGVRAESVHTDSDLTRSEAIEKLSSGEVDILFSVDLFNEGVDLPKIDTVLMIRPTESKILFLQQMGRGLRLSEGKERLVILDFVGNHHSFLNRPEMFFGGHFDVRPTRKQIINSIKNSTELLPDGCYVNFDLEFIEFLESLVVDQLDDQYKKLKATLKRRPTLLDFWRSGANLSQLRKQYGSWWEFIDEQGDASVDELLILEKFIQWFRDLTATKYTNPCKLILLQSLLDHNAINKVVTQHQLAEWSMLWFKKNIQWAAELPEQFQDLTFVADTVWISYWRDNPVKAWCIPDPLSQITWFLKDGMQFSFQQSLTVTELPLFTAMTKEVLEWRFSQYAAARLHEVSFPNRLINSAPEKQGMHLPFFPNIKIACGHFKTGRAGVEEYVVAPSGFGILSPDRHFIARASGDSMNGGKSPIYDGDYLLLEQITPENAGSISNQIVAIERSDESGGNQYLLRKVLKNVDGTYALRALNPEYKDLTADEGMVTFARYKGKVDPLDLFVGNSFMREQIPSLFGVEFNPGNWQSGHVVLSDQNVQVLLVTLNKQGKSSDHQYHDYFIDQENFHWQSQNSSGPDNKRGQQIIFHEKLGSRVFLFVRGNKLTSGKASPFKFYGEVFYESHEGSKPMSVIWRLQYPAESV